MVDEETRRRETLSVGTGGWVRWESHDLQSAVVYLRFVKQSGRWSPAELYVEAGTGELDTAVLRDIPLGRLEAWANSPTVAEVLGQHLGHARRVDLRHAVERFRPVHEALVNTQAVSHGSAALLRPTFRFEVPAGRNYGDDFYRGVADAYGTLASVTRSPAMAIAADNGVPVTTVHRWIKESRRRGLLGRGRVGKAG